MNSHDRINLVTLNALATPNIDRESKALAGRASTIFPGAEAGLLRRRLIGSRWDKIMAKCRSFWSLVLIFDHVGMGRGWRWAINAARQ
ncbi:MAG: hypothetical protein BVN32_03355 [Proteobacteria bacterium ST_bin14]|nr:MAG: hypothetical protein BVN32_03355 [Proteobacteria bacterium ST_bin14]